MTRPKYSLSFTTASLRRHDMLKLARLYVYHRDWNAVRDQVIENNVLQQRTTTTTKKLYQELSSRLKYLSDNELSYLVECPDSETYILLWVAVCRRYLFIRDFVIESLTDYRLNLKSHLDYRDFDVFFSAKLSLHYELHHTSAMTRMKVREVTFRILREIGLLGEKNDINALVPSAQTLSVLAEKDVEMIGFMDEHVLSHRK